MGIRDGAKRWYVKQKGVVRSLDPVIKNRGKVDAEIKRRGVKGKEALKRMLGKKRGR